MGDPNLPNGVTQEDIDRQDGEDDGKGYAIDPPDNG